MLISLFQIVELTDNIKAIFFMLVVSFILAYLITFTFSETKDFLLLIFFWGVSLIITFAVSDQDSGLLFTIAILMIIFSAYAKIKVREVPIQS